MTIALTLIVGALLALAYAYSGSFDAGADEPHGALVHRGLETARERSIAVRLDGILAPNLADPSLIAAGAGEYSQMCSGCHLAPGVANTELRRGLYPQPPELADEHMRREATGAARQFWIFKHGLKMTAMPAWGATHDDPTIWGMVAFLQVLPELTPEQYVQMTTNGETNHEASGRPHVHAGGATDHVDGDEP